jgi:hypothetical protein
MAQASVYDPDRIRFSIAGIAVSQGAGVSGYADGQFVAIKFPDSFMDVEGTDGSFTRSKTNKTLCDITMNLMQTNALNAALSALVTVDINTPNGQGIGSFVLADLSGIAFVSFSAAWIKKYADMEFDRGAKGRAWIMRGSLLTPAVVG